MIIDDLDILGTVILPDETETPLVIDADAVLTGPVTFQWFETIARWHAKITQVFCRMDLLETRDEHQGLR